MKKLFYLLCFLVGVKFTSAQTYTVPGAQVQPAWVFPLWFEDGSGAKDTLYFCYDSLSDNLYPSGDTIYGEKIIFKDTSKFWVGIWAYPAIDSTASVFVSNYVATNLIFNKGHYPLKMKWDDTLLYSSSLPYPDLSPLPRARISIICTDAFGNCPSDIELSLTAVASTFPFPLVDSAVFNGQENYFVGNTLGASLELRPFDSPLENAVINLQSRSIAVYPTLVSTGVWVESNERVEMEVLDMLGRKIDEYHRYVTHSNEYIDLTRLPHGYNFFLFKSSANLEVVKIFKL